MIHAHIANRICLFHNLTAVLKIQVAVIMREIITLQFGTKGNYVGTHFWNIQVCWVWAWWHKRKILIHSKEAYFTYDDKANPKSPSLLHDIHWRTGFGSDGLDTFLPRALIYDNKLAFGSLPKINELYKPVNNLPPLSTNTWYN